MTIFCPKGGLIGTSVTVEKNNGERLFVCEVEIHGEILADTGENPTETSTSTLQDQFSFFG